MRVVFAVVGALAVLGAARPGGAQPADALARVAVVATNEDAHDLEQALSERLSRLGLRVRLRRVGPLGQDTPPSDEGTEAPFDERTERARIWIDTQSAPDVAVRLATVHERTLDLPVERRIPRSESRAIMIEQVSEIVYDTLESMLANGQVTSSTTGVPPPAGTPADKSPGAPSDATPGVPAETRSPMATSATLPSPAPGRQARTRTFDVTLSANAFASARGVSDEAGALLGGGAAAELGTGRWLWHSSLWVSAAVNSPFDEHVAAFTLETTVSCLRAVPTIQIFDRWSVRIDAGIGGGIDLLRTIPRNIRSSPYPFDVPRTAVDAVATGRVVLRAPVPSGAAMIVATDVDYDPAPHAYHAPMAPGSPNGVFQPWSVRPAVMLGLCVPMVGRDACSHLP